VPYAPLRHWLLAYVGGLGFGLIVWKLAGSAVFGIPAIFAFMAAYIFLVGRYIVKPRTGPPANPAPPA
jgi:hypothetical protein